MAQNRGPAGYPARTGDSGRRHPGPGPPGNAGPGLFPRLLPGYELRDPAGPAPAPAPALRGRKTPGPGRNLSEPASLCGGTVPQSVGRRAQPHPDPAPVGGPGRTGQHPAVFRGVEPGRDGRARHPQPRLAAISRHPGRISAPRRLRPSRGTPTHPFPFPCPGKSP